MGSKLRAYLQALTASSLPSLPLHSLPVLTHNPAAVKGGRSGGGLARETLHEVLGDASEGAAAGFATVLLARLMRASGRRVLWCRQRRGAFGLYGPGLAAFGLDAGRLIAVTAQTRTDVLWTLEEALSSGSLAAVLGEVDGASPVAMRRLHLAAEARGVTALLLRSEREHNTPSPAATRWRIAPVVSADATAIRWRAELLKCRTGISAAEDELFGGWSRTWIIEWNHGTQSGLAVAAEVRDRSAKTAAANKLPRAG